MPKLKIKTKQFIYRNSLRWLGERRGLLTSSGKPDIEIATPPEFKGHPGIWTPEELFVASVNTCIMTTFLYYADKQGVGFLSYESDAEGVLEKVGARFMFSEIKVRPGISVKSESQTERIKELIALSEENCLISHSIKSKVIVISEVRREV